MGCTSAGVDSRLRLIQPQVCYLSLVIDYWRDNLDRIDAAGFIFLLKLIFVLLCFAVLLALVYVCC